MCGVLGVIDLEGRAVQPWLLKKMGQRLAHRGPDGEGLYLDGRVGLFHRRLAIIDLAMGQQPMTVGPYTISYNGEIYNYRELRRELEARGVVFRTTSDTEVLVRWYEAHGAYGLARLNGMFAFVLHDRTRDIVVAARDHFGIKPLYVTQVAGQLCFASEIKALLAHPELQAAPDHDGIREYLTFQYVLDDRTLFRNVRKLLPAEVMIVDLADGYIHRQRYWEPSFVLREGVHEDEALEELRWLLEDSARLQLRSDVPVGAYLSGGTDSSTVAMLAARHVGEPLQVFTGAFADGPQYDERHYARMVAEAAGARMHEIVPDGGELLQMLPRLIWHMDEPAAGPGLLPQAVVSREAAKHVKVCLGGQGGDEIFGGYARYLVAYLEQAIKGAIWETGDEGEHVVTFRSILPNLPALREYGPLLQHLWKDEVFAPMDRRYFRIIDRSGGEMDLLAPEYRAQFCREQLFTRFQRVFNDAETKSYYNKMTHFDMLTSLPALLHVEDRMSMMSSLESRVPLLDHRIVSLMTTLPPRMKFAGGELKYLLKRAVEGLLPDGVLHRRDKMGFPVPLHRWARGSAREFIADTLLSQASRERGIFDAAALERLIDREAAFGRKVWGALNLELWHRVFIDAD